MLAAGVKEYLALDPGLGEAVVSFGTVEEGKWSALVLVSKDIVRMRLARILKNRCSIMKDASVRTTKPFPATSLFSMPMEEEAAVAMCLLPRLLLGRQPQENSDVSGFVEGAHVEDQ